MQSACRWGGRKEKGDRLVPKRSGASGLKDGRRRGIKSRDNFEERGKKVGKMLRPKGGRKKKKKGGKNAKRCPLREGREKRKWQSFYNGGKKEKKLADVPRKGEETRACL